MNILFQITYRKIPSMAAEELHTDSNCPGTIYRVLVPKEKTVIIFAQSGLYLQQKHTVLKGISCICSLSCPRPSLFNLSWVFPILSSSRICCIISRRAQPNSIPSPVAIYYI